MPVCRALSPAHRVAGPPGRSCSDSAWPVAFRGVLPPFPTGTDGPTALRLPASWMKWLQFLKHPCRGLSHLAPTLPSSACRRPSTNALKPHLLRRLGGGHDSKNPDRYLQGACPTSCRVGNTQVRCRARIMGHHSRARFPGPFRLDWHPDRAGLPPRPPCWRRPLPPPARWPLRRGDYREDGLALQGPVDSQGPRERPVSLLGAERTRSAPRTAALSDDIPTRWPNPARRHQPSPAHGNLGARQAPA